MKASDRLKYGICDCDYPCSCVEFDDVLYRSWKDIIDELSSVNTVLENALRNAVKKLAEIS